MLAAFLGIFYNLLYLVLIIAILLSVVWGARASSVFRFWLRIEVNILSFVALIGLTLHISVLTLKYFLVQAAGSALMIWALLALYPLGGDTVLIILVFAGLIFKLGRAPLHFWFLELFPRLGWTLGTLLATTQKFLPLLILINFKGRTLDLAVWLNIVWPLGIVFFSSLIKKVLALASVFSLRWLLLTRRAQLMGSFLVAYGLALALVLAFIRERRQNPSSERPDSPLGSLPLFLSLVNLAGMPPFGLFWVKVNLLRNALSDHPVEAGAVTLTAGFFLYFYLKPRWLLLTLKSTSPGSLLGLSSRDRLLLFLLICRRGAWFWVLGTGVRHEKFWFSKNTRDSVYPRTPGPVGQALAQSYPKIRRACPLVQRKAAKRASWN